MRQSCALCFWVLAHGVLCVCMAHGRCKVYARGQGMVARYELLLLGQGLLNDGGLWFFSILRGELVGGYGGREWLPVVPVVL